MRLLERKPDGELVMHEFVGKDDTIPPYAILSHTWGPDNEEVTFQDVEAGAGQGKAGYRKIEFCAEKAWADGLRFFWIDTCCINKWSHSELVEAITLMFRWYKNAARCYAYLLDVSIKGHGGGEQLSRYPWELAFRRSRWFTRGWTIQELIAPARVKFFTVEGEPLGEKSTLGTMINEVTGISKKALEGDAMCNFSIEERMSWAEKRSTQREEDMVYSLLGIFDVSMPVIYGEGRERASRRFKREINDSLEGMRLGSEPDSHLKGTIPPTLAQSR
jgi:hypothetical protein